MDINFSGFKKGMSVIVLMAVMAVSAGCATAYKAKPMPFKTAAAYPNAMEVAGTIIGAKVFMNKKETLRRQT